VFVFLLQVRWEGVEGGPLHLFAVFSAIVWMLWLAKVLLSRRYRPWRAPCDATTSVIVPVVDEPVDLFRDVLSRIAAQRPTELIVVLNGPRNPGLEQVCDDLGVGWLWTPVAGKRNAVRLGVEAASGEICVLVDSDTVWSDDTLAELVKPFADPRIGGVTSRQRILRHDRCLLTRWADWLENARALYMMPAQSVLGCVGCLPGRTIAFRREILVRVMDRFLTERFLGVFLEVSDDRTLTNLTLQAGYRTAYQYTSLVYTDAPTMLRKLFRQQLRWARGSQYNTLRMLPWMLAHTPTLAVFFLADIVLPFLLLGALIGWVYRSITGDGVNFYAAMLQAYGVKAGIARVVALAIVASLLSMGVRHIRHLSERPADFLRLPAFILISTLFLMPIRIIGFFRMAHVSGWGTRQHAYAGRAAAARPALAEPALLAAGRPGPTAGSLDADPPAARPAAGGRRRLLNPYAALPYLIGTIVIVLEVLHHA
jgi:cellulose synthase/poly-beta-1,6-N-acetylglucosamine synthase-like glycosyltransferase